VPVTVGGRLADFLRAGCGLTSLNDDDKSGTSGWPFIHLFSAEPDGSDVTLVLTGGGARVLAARFLDVADKVGMPDGPTT
jgi:hypothetical protein